MGKGSLLVRILQRSRTDKRYFYTHPSFHPPTHGICSHDYGGWEVPRSTAGKLKTQERPWYNSSLKADADWCSAQRQQRERERVNFLLFRLYVLVGPSSDWMKPTYWGGQPTLLSLLCKMWTSSRNTLTDTPTITFGQISGLLWPHQVDTWNYHREPSRNRSFSKTVWAERTVYMIRLD